MSERLERNGPERFIQRYVDSYPPVIVFHANSLLPVETRSTRDFRTSRHLMMRELLEINGKKRKEMSKSLFAEHLVTLALQPIFDPAGFTITAAPQSLEHGNDQKGIDLLIHDPEHIVYLGIDIKLRQGKSIRERDGHGWNKKLKAPFIYLSLGDFSPDDSNSDNIKSWLSELAIPKISRSKNIPDFTRFRAYLNRRLETNVAWYQERLADRDIYHYDSDLPNSIEDEHLLLEKLAIMNRLLEESMHL